MTTVADILNTLGRAEVAKACGVTKFAVKAARSKGFFPASWYLVLRAMCEEHSIECPPDLFSFKSANERGAA